MEEIETERLILRPVPADAAKAILDGDYPEGIDLADGYPSEFSLEVLEMVASRKSSAGPDGFGPYFIHLKEDDSVVGEIGAGPIADDAAQTGYSLVEGAWNHGYATEALTGLIEHALADDRVKRVFADTIDHMTASRRVMEKSGMKLTGEHLDEIDGERVTIVRYEIVASV